MNIFCFVDFHVLRKFSTVFHFIKLLQLTAFSNVFLCGPPTYDLEGATRCEFKNRFPCKTIGCDKNTDVRKSFFYIVEHRVVVCCALLYVIVHSRTFAYTH